jgi:tetratricopeptide (TPR) repeat protein
VVAFATLPYLNSLVNGFVYDDDNQVLRNPYVRSLRYVKEIFTSNVWSFWGTRAITNYYRPTMTLGYLFCYKLFGMRAWGFHLVSLLLHVGVVCLVFGLAERLTGDRVYAFVAAALFALHPIHTESVDWIAAVTDLELTFFYLLAFSFFLALARPGGGRSGPGLVLMLGAFALALLSKEQAMTLPALATVYEHFWRSDRGETRASQKMARYGGLWLAGLVYLIVRIHVLGKLAPKSSFRKLNLAEVVFSAVALAGQYVAKLLWPVRLCAFYVFQASQSIFDPRVLAGLLVLVALAGLFFYCWRSPEPNVRLSSFHILWFLATLGPVLNAHWVAANVFTERYLYLPSVGAAWLAGLGASKLWSRTASRPAERKALLLAGVVVGALFAVRTIVRNRDWNNDIVLYTRTLELSPDAYIIANNLGTVYWHQGDRQKAEEVWRAALAQNPNRGDLLNNLGMVAARRKEYAQAIDLLQQAIKFKPDEADPHRNLGTVYRLMGMPGPAEVELRKALELSPLDYRFLNDLGQLYAEEERLNEAAELFQTSVRNWPNALAYDFLGEIAIKRNVPQEAERDFRAALDLDERDSNAHFGLGFVYRAAGRTADALRQYQAGLSIDPTDGRALAAVRELHP